jgi:hypothetical protein
MKISIAASLLVLTTALPAQAQLTLAIQDGRVTLEAKNVPARQILAEWARVGGTRVVGAEKLTGAPLTLKIVDMPERQALDIVLRNAAGYMAAPRQASSPAGASTYDRILILATSTAPASPAAARTTSAPGNGQVAPGRRVPPRPPGMQPQPPQPVEAEESQEQTSDDDPADTGVPQQPPVFTFPSPNQVPGNQTFVPIPAGGPTGRPGTVAAPVISLQPNPNGQPTVYTFVPTQEAGQAPAPAVQTTPFGAVGTATPGVIQQPAPAPGQPQRPPK